MGCQQGLIQRQLGEYNRLMTVIIIFIFGLIVGSFLNAAIHRLFSGESIVSDRSRCPKCHRELHALDLIPVISFILLRARCRYCHKKISWQYPLVELITAVTFVLLFWNYEFRITNYELWFNLILSCFFIVIAVFDLKHYLILDKIVFSALVLAIVYNILRGQLFSGLLAGFGVAGFFLAQYLLSKGKWIGFGDVKFGLLLGNLAGWPASLLVLMLAYFLGAVIGIALIILGRKRLGSKLPFGVFLGASAIIVMLYGDLITNWYLRLIGF